VSAKIELSGEFVNKLAYTLAVLDI